MRILYAHSFYRIAGGEDQHVRDQVVLVSRDHDVELISEMNSDLKESPAAVTRMLYSRVKTREMEEVIERFAPDVVHVHNIYPSLGPAVLLAAFERGVPVVMTIHNFRLRCPNGIMFTEGGMCRRCETGVYANALVHRCFPTKTQAGAYAAVLWVHRFLMRFEKRIDRFIVPSEFMRQRVLGWGIDKDRVSLVRHFIPLYLEAGTSSIGSYGAFFGRLSSEKGVNVLLAALRRAGDPPFLIVGDGPHRRALVDLTRRLGLHNTRFLGWLPTDEVARLMAAARFVALPSVGEETASLAALEALAAGRPLLVSERGALPELVATGAGLASRPGDAIDVAEKISLLVNDDALCREASIQALRFAHRWLDPKRHLDQLESIYGQLCS